MAASSNPEGEYGATLSFGLHLSCCLEGHAGQWLCFCFGPPPSCIELCSVLCLKAALTFRLPQTCLPGL